MSRKYNTLKDAKQDLIAAREQLKHFRHDVALLKKKGLITKTKYDARSVTPTKYLNSVIKKFSDVLSGKATAVKVSKENLKYYKKQGYRVANNKVIGAHYPNEKVIATRGNFRTIVKGANGSITSIELTNLPRENIMLWSEEISKIHVKLKSNEQIVFQIGESRRSSQSFKTLQQMIDFMQHYESYEQADEDDARGKHENSRNFIKSIHIWKMERDTDFPAPIISPEHAAWRSEQRRIKHEKYLDRMDENRYTRYLALKAAAEKERRANMTEAQKIHAREKTRDRVKQYRQRLKNAQKNSSD